MQYIYIYILVLTSCAFYNADERPNVGMRVVFKYRRKKKNKEKKIYIFRFQRTFSAATVKYKQTTIILLRYGAAHTNTSDTATELHSDDVDDTRAYYVKRSVASRSYVWDRRRRCRCRRRWRHRPRSGYAMVKALGVPLGGEQVHYRRFARAEHVVKFPGQSPAWSWPENHKLFFHLFHSVPCNIVIIVFASRWHTTLPRCFQFYYIQSVAISLLNGYVRDFYNTKIYNFKLYIVTNKINFTIYYLRDFIGKFFGFLLSKPTIHSYIVYFKKQKTKNIVLEIFTIDLKRDISHSY